MQIDRLLEIVTLLVNEKQITAKTLANRFDVSIRTIYRDIDTLTISGIPICVKKGKGGGISIPPNYKLNKSFLTEKEKESFVTALSIIKGLDLIANDKLLDKADSLFGMSHNDWISVDLHSWRDKSKNKFYELKDAITNKKLIELQYFNVKGEKSTRLVEPLKIYFKGHSWYLVAFCKKKKDFRNFKINRILNIKELEEHFDRVLPKDYIIEKKYVDSETINLKLKFHKSVAYKVHDDFEDVKIKVLDKDYLLVEVSLNDGKWLINYILSYGSMVEIIEPSIIQQKIKIELKKTLSLYKDKL